tara:strand:- start:9278 stop:9496 length:219 start_codon:yes stop_codon:yes gene_type:complete
LLQVAAVRWRRRRAIGPPTPHSPSPRETLDATRDRSPREIRTRRARFASLDAARIAETTPRLVRDGGALNRG